MSRFFHQYPYENFHELNLDWILSKINEFDAKLNEWKLIAEELEIALGDIDAMKEEIASIENAISDLGTIRSNIEALKLASADTNDRLNSLIDDINQLKTDWENVTKLFDDVYKYIDIKFRGLEHDVDFELTELLNHINSININLQNQIDDIYSRLDDAGVDVYNPIRNSRETLDINNLDVYRDLAGNYCPTAFDYLKLGLTASEYASYNLSAYDYFKNGFKLLHCDYVFAPVVGFKQEISVALDSIVNLIMGTLTADDYADLNLSADDYASLGLTSGGYIVYNTNGTPIDASTYSSINKLNSGLLMATN